MATVIHVRGGIVVQSLLLAAVAGTLAAGLGLVLCWLMTGRRWFQVVVLTLLAADWAMPGPVVGFGLKETISKLLNFLRSDPAHPDPVAIALWYGPSPLPILWVYLLRFLPCAVALLWPVVRLLPREWHETALLEGASPWQDFRRVTLPLLLPVTLRATLAVAILALGEISASKLVETPGSQTFAQEIFDRMHYGVENDLAACCLVLLAAVVVSGSVVASTQKALGIRHWALLRQRPWKSPNACEPMPNA
ncbi:MAG: ABC transporter permease subunit [Planctomycetes bacterium]|nr:ABC transporter permease subunit [Planctomycetota bacterium]